MTRVASFWLALFLASLIWICGAVTVSSSAQLLTAIQAAQPGDIIECLGGDYSAFDQGAFGTAIIKAEPRVTVRAASRANPPVFRGIFQLPDWQGFVFDGLIFDPPTRDQFGFPSETGFRCARCQRITVRNCVFRNLHTGLVLHSRSDQATIEYNLFEGIGMDAMRVYERQTNLVIRNNRFINPNIDIRRSDQIPGDTYVENLAGEMVLVTAVQKGARHPDFLQFANNNLTGLGPAENVTIENNWVRTFNGACQAIFMFSETAAKATTPLLAYYHKNFVVRGNYIESSHPHAIAVGGHKNVLVERNLIRQLDIGGEPVWKAGFIPTVTILAKDNTGTIQNNVIVRTLQYFSGATFNGVTASNVVSNTAVPAGWTMPLNGPYAYESATTPAASTTLPSSTTSTTTQASTPSPTTTQPSTPALTTQAATSAPTLTATSTSAPTNTITQASSNPSPSSASTTKPNPSSSSIAPTTNTNTITNAATATNSFTPAPTNTGTQAPAPITGSDKSSSSSGALKGWQIALIVVGVIVVVVLAAAAAGIMYFRLREKSTDGDNQYQLVVN